MSRVSVEPSRKPDLDGVPVGLRAKRCKTNDLANLDILHLLLKCETQKERDFITNVLRR